MRAGQHRPGVGGLPKFPTKRLLLFHVELGYNSNTSEVAQVNTDEAGARSSPTVLSAHLSTRSELQTTHTWEVLSNSTPGQIYLTRAFPIPHDGDYPDRLATQCNCPAGVDPEASYRCWHAELISALESVRLRGIANEWVDTLQLYNKAAEGNPAAQYSLLSLVVEDLAAEQISTRRLSTAMEKYALALLKANPKTHPQLLFATNYPHHIDLVEQMAADDWEQTGMSTPVWTGPADDIRHHELDELARRSTFKRRIPFRKAG